MPDENFQPFNQNSQSSDFDTDTEQTVTSDKSSQSFNQNSQSFDFDTTAEQTVTSDKNPQPFNQNSQSFDFQYYNQNFNQPMQYQQPQYYGQNNIPQFNPDFKYPPYPPYPPLQPYNPPSPTKKGGVLKTVLICTSSVLVVVSMALVLLIISNYNTQDNIFENNNSNNTFETSYGTASQLPDAPKVSADENGPQISTQETSESLTAGTVNRAYKKVSPSVVCITSYKAGTDYALTESGEGSGIIISSDGYIATNSHVVDNSTETGVMITLNSGEQYLGTIIGIDQKTDLAVLKISAENLTPADFADSEKVMVGQETYAIGNPGGSAFSNSLTLGTISAVNRVLSSNAYIKYIQTDAAINPGNSGGALVNEYGQVIGMNTAKLVGTDYEGMGFAIPSNTVIEIINKLIKYGYVNDRGTLGIEGKTCSLYTSKKNNVPQGMIITKINTKSSLYSTQVMNNDIITAINGIEIKSSTEFIDQLQQFHPNDKITLTIFRVKENTNGKPYSYNVEATLISENEN